MHWRHDHPGMICRQHAQGLGKAFQNREDLRPSICTALERLCQQSTAASQASIILAKSPNPQLRDSSSLICRIAKILHVSASNHLWQCSLYLGWSSSAFGAALTFSTARANGDHLSKSETILSLELVLRPAISGSKDWEVLRWDIFKLKLCFCQ